MPGWELRIWQHKLAREPTAVERTQYQIAALHCAVLGLAGRKGKRIKIEDVLVFRKAWDYQHRTGDSDHDCDVSQIVNTLIASGGGRLVVNKRPSS